MDNLWIVFFDQLTARSKVRKLVVDSYLRYEDSLQESPIGIPDYYGSPKFWCYPGDHSWERGWKFPLKTRRPIRSPNEHHRRIGWKPCYPICSKRTLGLLIVRPILVVSSTVCPLNVFCSLENFPIKFHFKIFESSLRILTLTLLFEMVSLSLLLESSFRTISLSLLSESSLITSWNHLVEFEIWNSDSKRRILNSDPLRIPTQWANRSLKSHKSSSFEAYKSKYWAERARMSKNTSLCVS